MTRADKTDIRKLKGTETLMSLPHFTDGTMKLTRRVGRKFVTVEVKMLDVLGDLPSFLWSKYFNDKSR